MSNFYKQNIYKHIKITCFC